MTLNDTYQRVDALGVSITGMTSFSTLVYLFTLLLIFLRMLQANSRWRIAAETRRTSSTAVSRGQVDTCVLPKAGTRQIALI